MNLRRYSFSYSRLAITCAVLVASVGLFIPLEANSAPVEPSAQISAPETLPRSVLRQLKRSVAQQVGVSPRQLRMESYSRETWPDGCLGLGGIADLCLAALVEGWRVSLTDGETQWFVRSNLDGSVSKLEVAQAGDPLPDTVRDAVFEAIERESSVPVSALQVVSFSRETWPNGCLGLGGRGARCTQALVEGWRVGVTNGERQWIYRTDLSGNAVLLESSQQAEQLPDVIRTAVFEAIANQFGSPISQLQVVSFSRETWPDGCLGLGAAGAGCTQALVDGWRVGVTDGENQWIYRTDLEGRTVALESSELSERLPDAVREAVLAAAAEASGLPTDQLRIDSAQQRTFDGCFGLDPGPRGACTRIAIPGWQVIVTSDRQTWVFHSNSDGSDVRLNPTAGVNPQQVQLTILPQGDRLSTPRGTVFRAQSIGGIAGAAVEVKLLSDGQLVRSAIDADPASEEIIGQLTPEQVAQFEQQLQQLRPGNLNGLRYGSAVPVADQITVTLAYRGLSVQYEDTIVADLPGDLQSVIALWQNTSATR